MANEYEVQGVMTFYDNTVYRVYGIRYGDMLKESSVFFGMIDHNNTHYALFGVPIQPHAPPQPNDDASSGAIAPAEQGVQGNDIKNEQSLNSKFSTSLKIV